jgi:putative transposase
MPDNSRPNRHSPRLPDYDYAIDGAYFVTICTHERLNLFGEVIDAVMQLNALGEIVSEEWQRSGEMRKEITLDEWGIMPNHLHAIVFITQEAPASGRRDVRLDVSTGFGHTPRGPRPRSLSSLVGGFKAAATSRVNVLRGTPGMPVWQGRFYDHILRDERDLDLHRAYILNNPGRWAEDRDNRIFLDS